MTQGREGLETGGMGGAGGTDRGAGGIRFNRLRHTLTDTIRI